MAFRHRVLLVACTLALTGWRDAVAGEGVGPRGVSPGRFEGPARIDTRCPTFSWVGQPDASGYEIVVLAWTPDEPRTETTLRQTLPAGALSWTPALDQCLEWGGRYAWSVSVPGAAGGWSKPLLFEVVSHEAWLAGSRQEPAAGSAAGFTSTESLPDARPISPELPTREVAPPVAASPAPNAPASNLLMVNGIPVALESYDHALVFTEETSGVPDVTTTSFVALGSVSITLPPRCSLPFVTRWNVLALANAVAFSLDASDAAVGDLGISLDDPTGSSVGNADVQTFSVDGLLTATSLEGIALFKLFEDVGPGSHEIRVLGRRDDLGSADFRFNNLRIFAMALGFDCQLLLPP
jgi:hypothetical protein